MTDGELQAHLVAQHNCDASYFRYGSPKARVELHDDEHRPRADRAVWKEGAPALTQPYDHSTHGHR